MRRFLLALVLGLPFLAAAPVTGAAAVSAGNCASGFAAATDIRLGNTAPLSEERVNGKLDLGYDFASGCAVAARAAAEAELQ